MGDTKILDANEINYENKRLFNACDTLYSLSTLPKLYLPIFNSIFHTCNTCVMSNSTEYPLTLPGVGHKEWTDLHMEGFGSKNKKF